MHKRQREISQRRRFSFTPEPNWTEFYAVAVEEICPSALLLVGLLGQGKCYDFSYRSLARNMM